MKPRPSPADSMRPGTAAGLVPFLLFLLVGGVWADRLSRRRIMLCADLARTVLQWSAAALSLTGCAHVWELAALQFGLGICDGLFRPAYSGHVPQTVSPERLPQANALKGFGDSSSIVFGAALGGIWWPPSAQDWQSLSTASASWSAPPSWRSCTPGRRVSPTQQLATRASPETCLKAGMNSWAAHGYGSWWAVSPSTFFWSRAHSTCSVPLSVAPATAAPGHGALCWRPWAWAKWLGALP